MNAHARTSAGSDLPIASIVCFNFASYVCNGLPLAVLPGFVLNQLGYGSALAGLLIGTQYLLTLLARPLAGALADRRGPKQAVLLGLAGLVVTGSLTALAFQLRAAPPLSFGLLLLGRVFHGLSGALVSIPCCTWAIGLYGAQRSARAMSWNGIAAYGGTAAGAPLGVWVSAQGGLGGIGLTMVLVGGLALLFASRRPAVPPVHAERRPFGDIFRTVLPDGLAIACSSAGFGILTAFIALYFDSLGWAHAAWGLSGFGLAFIAARLVAPNVVTRFGGYRVVAVSLVVQSFGLLLVWLAPSPALALAGAALAGLGASWVYPGLALETLARNSAADRNAALSTLSLFFDLALGLAGPLMGLLAAAWGLSKVFACAGLLSLLGFLVVLALQRRRPSEPGALS
jgi:MFS family permease